MEKLTRLNDFYPHKNWGLLRGSIPGFIQTGSFYIPEIVEINKPASKDQRVRIEHLEYLSELMQEIFPDGAVNNFETNLFKTEQAKNYLELSS